MTSRSSPPARPPACSSTARRTWWQAPESVHSLVSKLKTQKGIVIEHKVMAGANHFFEDKTDELTKICSTYLDKRLSRES